MLLMKLVLAEGIQMEKLELRGSTIKALSVYNDELDFTYTDIYVGTLTKRLLVRNRDLHKTLPIGFSSRHSMTMFDEDGSEAKKVSCLLFGVMDSLIYLDMSKDLRFPDLKIQEKHQKNLFEKQGPY
jgi:hypothetical protein